MDYNEKDYPVYDIADLISALQKAKFLGYKFCQLYEWFDEDDKSRVLSVEAIDDDDGELNSALFSVDIEDIWEVKPDGADDD